jgi:CRISPR-associated endonuclease Csn1
MYDAEFDKIWSVQAHHNAALFNPDAKKHVHDLIFNQRPLKSQAGLVGPCELEPNKKRAPKAILPAQRFRILQKVNDLRLCFEDGTARELTPEERKLLANHMDTVREVTFPGLRKLLGIKKSEGVEFNLERGGEKKLKGNTSAAPLRDVFGDRWDVLTVGEKNSIIGELMGIDRPETIERRGVEVWGLAADAAKALAKVRLEDGYCALSREALRKLLPLMEEGIAFKTAEDQAYGQSSWVKHTCDRLMPVADSGIAVRNPVVMRCLTELRKVVNAVLRKYGKPDEIHIELARELKKSREDRMRISKDNRRRQDMRNTGYEAIQKKADIPMPKRSDVEKYLLAVECSWICPYTGKGIGFENLFGDHPQFDVEHIIPFSRCLDDSFMNKTLCYHEENRSVKGNQTPWEAYAYTGRWDEIIGRVQRFNGDAAQQKLERFQSRDVKDYEGFVDQKLNDTRYASKLAARYLGWLYGPEYRSRIQTNTGQITAYLRDAWRLNGILGVGETKTRDDHRHHAIDALVIALTSRSAVKQLSDAAKKQHQMKGRARGFGKLVEQPWNSFLEDTRAAVDSVLVSHRVDHRVSGRLHEDTFYSPPRVDDNGKNYHVVRKPLGDMFSEGDIDQIVDLAVRNAVREHFEASGRNAKKAFGDPANHPVLCNNGSRTPIHRVRIRRNIAAFPVGEDKEVRYVTPDSNHHMEVVEKKKNSKTRWHAVIVDRYVAAQRMRSGECVVKKDHGDDTRFMFTIASGEVFRLKEGESYEYYVARTIWGSNVEYVSINDSRKKADIKGASCWYVRSIDKLREMEFEKVIVSPLGEPIVAHD